MSGSAHKAQLADGHVNLAAFSAIAALGSEHSNETMIVIKTNRVLRYLRAGASLSIAIMTATGKRPWRRHCLTDQPEDCATRLAWR